MKREFERGFRLGLEIGLRSAAVMARRQREFGMAQQIDDYAVFVQRRATELAAGEAAAAERLGHKL